MISYIIGSSKLIRNPQNLQKHYKYKVGRKFGKLVNMLQKPHGPNKVGLGSSSTWIICTKTLLDTPMDTSNLTWSKLSKSILKYLF